MMAKTTDLACCVIKSGVPRTLSHTASVIELQTSQKICQIEQDAVDEIWRILNTGGICQEICLNNILPKMLFLDIKKWILHIPIFKTIERIRRE